MAEVCVTDHEAAVEWYGAVFGRPPDRRPMDGLAEWQLSGTEGVQVFAADVQVVSSGFSVASVRDPDGNTLTFAGSRPEA